MPSSLQQQEITKAQFPFIKHILYLHTKLKKMKQIITLLSLFLSLFSYSNSITMERINSIHGLSQNNVMTIIKDSDGFMWFGTYDGLNRYDGYDFMVFKNDENDPNTIASNFIQGLAEDQDGNIWVGSFQRGISVLNKHTQVVTRFQNTEDNQDVITSNMIKKIMCDSKGRIWVGTNDGINIFTKQDDGTYNIQKFKTEKNNPKSLGSGDINGLYEDSQNRFWVGSQWSAGLMITNDAGEPQNRFHHIHGGNIINRIDDFKDSPEGLLISHSGGVSVLVYNNIIPERSGLLHLERHSSSKIAVDINGNLWSAGATGLTFFERTPEEEIPYSFEFYINEGETKNTLSNQFVRSLYYDDSGILWIGTNGGGICKYNANKTKFKHFKKTNEQGSIGHNKVFSIYEDKYENLWLATEGDGINFLPHEKQKQYTNGFTSIAVNPPQEQNFAMDVLDISNTNEPVIWAGVGYNAKLIELTPNSEGIWEVQRKYQDVISHQIMVILKDDNNNIWLASYDGGLYKYISAEDRLVSYKTDNSIIPSNIIRNIFEDSQGRLWVGTDAGLMLLTRDQKAMSSLEFTLFTYDKNNANSISNNYTVPIIETKDNTIWIGTFGGGLNKYIEGTSNNNGTFVSYTVENGLPNNTIKQIIEDNSGNLWITTNNGVCRMNPTDIRMINFDIYDGLQDMEFVDLSGCKLHDGEILIGGVKGFNAFYPEDVKEDSIPPKIVLTDFYISNEKIEVQKIYNERVILKQNLNKTDAIHLKYNENNINIAFAGLHFSLPEKNQYKYILEGADEQWTIASADARFARYTNLNHGEYTFKVLASNCYGIWANTPKTVTIIIKPPFWKTLFFRICVAILTISLGVYLYQRKVRKYRQEQTILQTKIDKGVKELKKSQAEVDAAKKEVENTKQEIRNRELEEKEMRYFNAGLARFSNIISKNDELGALCHDIIAECIDYLNCQLGAIYIVSNENENSELVLTGSYGINNENSQNQKYAIGEGNIGTCFLTGSVLELENNIEGYLKVSSGLGEITPKDILFVPIMNNNDKIGVFELASFEKIEQYKVNFLLKLGENITSNILLMRVLDKNHKIIEDTKLQAEELKAQDEEMRQNLEEMMATQEENARLNDDFTKEQEMLNKKIAELEATNRDLKAKLKTR